MIHFADQWHPPWNSISETNQISSNKSSRSFWTPFVRNFQWCFRNPRDEIRHRSDETIHRDNFCKAHDTLLGTRFAQNCSFICFLEYLNRLKGYLVFLIVFSFNSLINYNFKHIQKINLFSNTLKYWVGSR